MSTRNDYSAEEWEAISSAPVVSGLVITLSDKSGPLGILKEAMAVGKAITDSAAGDAPQVVKSVAESVKSAGGRPELPDMPRGDRTQRRDALLGALRTAVAAVERKSPAEAEAFKRWLVSVATMVANASKEGGFLGVGGSLVSNEEQAALQRLSEVLGVGSAHAAAYSRRGSASIRT